MLQSQSWCSKFPPFCKPSEIAKGHGLKGIPGAIDGASNHLGKIRREVRKVKNSSISALHWNVSDFEKDETDLHDKKLAGDPVFTSKVKKMNRPYLLAHGFEDGINYVICMTPFMASVFSQSEFVETDITYNETKEYWYLFNLVALNNLTLRMVVGRVRMDQQGTDAYTLAFRKLFTKCQSLHPQFKPGESLLGVVVD